MYRIIFYFLLFLAHQFWGGSEKSRLSFFLQKRCDLGTFTTDSAGQLDVLGHDGHTFGMDGAQVGVLEKADQVGLAGFLQGHDGAALETQIGFEILSDFTDQTLEWQLSDQELSGFLVTSDFTKGDGTRSVSVRLLDASSCRG